MALIDTRLIQTAVIGGRESGQPVILPEQPHNLDEFRRQFGTDRFWCGTLLGGCGQKLRQAAVLAMVFKLAESAQVRRRAITAPHLVALVALVRTGARFERGVLVEREQEAAA